MGRLRRREGAGAGSHQEADKAKVKGLLKVWLGTGSLVVVERLDPDRRETKDFVEVAPPGGLILPNLLFLPVFCTAPPHTPIEGWWGWARSAQPAQPLPHSGWAGWARQCSIDRRRLLTRAGTRIGDTSQRAAAARSGTPGCSMQLVKPALTGWTWRIENSMSGSPRTSMMARSGVKASTRKPLF